MSAARGMASVVAGVLAIILGATLAQRTFATDSGPAGGHGGGPFRVTCQPGSYIAGLTGRVGDWIDQVSMQCAHWNAQAQHLEPTSTTPMPIGESHGGGGATAYCPSGSVVRSMSVMTLQSDNRLVSNLSLICHPVERNDAETDVEFGGHGASGAGLAGGTLIPWVALACPPKELAVGLFGRAGLFVDAIGLVCGPAPKSPISAGALGGVSGGRVPLSASAVVKSEQWAAPSARRNTAVGQLATSPSSVPSPAPGPAPFDLPAGPTPGVPIARGVRHNYPFINDYSMSWGMLDWCRESATNCGAPAASAYCAAVDAGQHPHALEFEKFEAAGRYRVTINVATRTQCTAATCGAFTHITCGP